MGYRLAEGSEERFASYVEELASVIGHADRVEPLEAYRIGLLLPGERKSVEPMAGISAPERISAQHQSKLHFSGSSDEKVLGRCARWWCRRWDGTSQSGRESPAPQIRKTPKNITSIRTQDASPQRCRTLCGY